MSQPFDVSFEHCSHDYAELQHCRIDHKATGLLSADSANTKENTNIRIICDFLLQKLKQPAQVTWK